MPFLDKDSLLFKKDYFLNKKYLIKGFEVPFEPYYGIYTNNSKWWTTTTTATTSLYQTFSAATTLTTLNFSGYFKAATTAWKPVTLTPEQLLAAKRKAIVDKARITRAKNKARRLLLENLDIRQTLDFERFGFFFIEGSEGNLYQIRTGRSHNVRLFDPISHKPLFTLCAHPTEAVPDFDTMLAQKLWIEHDEPGFVKMANRGTVYAREVEEREARLIIDTLPRIVTQYENLGMALAI